MTTAAEEYRKLVNRLESIVSEEGEVTYAPGYDPATGRMAGEPAPTAAAPSDAIPTIEAPTFKQAYAQAVKQGLKKFKWCGVFTVKERGQGPVPTPPKPPVKPAGKVDYIGQQNPLGGDAENPMSFAPNSGFGA